MCRTAMLLPWEMQPPKHTTQTPLSVARTTSEWHRANTAWTTTNSLECKGRARWCRRGAANNSRLHSNNNTIARWEISHRQRRTHTFGLSMNATLPWFVTQRKQHQADLVDHIYTHKHASTHSSSCTHTHRPPPPCMYATHAGMVQQTQKYTHFSYKNYWRWNNISIV